MFSSLGLLFQVLVIAFHFRVIVFNFRVTIFEFRVTFFDFRVIVFKFRVFSQFRVIVCNFRVTIFEFRVIVFKFRLKFSSCGLLLSTFGLFIMLQSKNDIHLQTYCNITCVILSISFKGFYSLQALLSCMPNNYQNVFNQI